jgi:hypothetical protein
MLYRKVELTSNVLPLISLILLKSSTGVTDGVSYFSDFVHERKPTKLSIEELFRNAKIQLGTFFPR